MTTLVADTSGVVSLGIAGDTDSDPLSLCFDTYNVVLPDAVIDELRDISAYDDVDGQSARSVLAVVEESNVRSVALDETFPLDDGENAAVSLANETDASLFLCDEFNRLGLIHASLATSRLVTTPTLLAVFVRRDELTSSDALDLLERIIDARSWEANSYVRRARSLFE